MSHAQIRAKQSAGSLLTSRMIRAKMYTAKAVTPSKLVCEVRMAEHANLMIEKGTADRRLALINC